MHPLRRNISRPGQIGGTFLVGLLLMAIAIPLLRAPYREHGQVIMYLVGGAFALFALLLFYAAIHQLLAMRSPTTEVEIGMPKLPRGQKVHVLIRQRGPMDLESLRANLVGQKRVRRRKSTFTDSLGTFPFFDSGPVVIDDTMPLQREATLTVPKDILASGSGVTWQIEIWGKVRGRADFQHIFPVTVI